MTDITSEALSLAKADIIADLEAQTIAQARTIREQAVIIREHQAADVLAVEAIRSLTAELAQCKEGDEIVITLGKCGHPMSKHRQNGCEVLVNGGFPCGCTEAAKDACTCGHSLDSHTKSGVHPCGECECLMFWAEVTK